MIYKIDEWFLYKLRKKDIITCFQFSITLFT